MAGLAFRLVAEGVGIAHRPIKKLFFFIGNMWGLPILSTVLLISPVRAGASFIKFWDQGWLEELGGQGAFNKITFSSVDTDKWNLIGVKNYLMLFFIFILLMFIIGYSSSLKRAW